MNRSRALILGGVSWNTIVHLDQLPQPGDPTVFARSSYEALGGTGAGKALNLARLGWACELWAGLGDDRAAILAVDELRATGGSGVESGEITVRRLSDPGGTEKHLNLMVGGQRTSIYLNASSARLDFDRDELARSVHGADLVVLNILAHCADFIPVISEVADARGNSFETWVDLHVWDGRADHHRPFLAAASSVQLSSDRLARWRDLGRSLVESGKRTVIVTHADAGASAIDSRGVWVDVDAVAATVIDTNGAGDAFFSGFVEAARRGADLDQALQSAAAIAAQAVGSRHLAPDPHPPADPHIRDDGHG
ncbi:MAG: carbohydrate kinase family protein [Acidimicrobiales bacterium]